MPFEAYPRLARTIFNWLGVTEMQFDAAEKSNGLSRRRRKIPHVCENMYWDREKLIFSWGPPSHNHNILNFHTSPLERDGQMDILMDGLTDTYSYHITSPRQKKKTKQKHANKITQPN